MDHRNLTEGVAPLHLGSVSYVNALPLIHGLEGDPGLEVSEVAPAAVARGLLERRFDAGLVPAIELLRQPDLMPVSDACIAAQGPVDSVLLLLRRPAAQVRDVVLDPDSRTSQVLARIVLRHLHGASPTYREADPLTAWERGDGDAVLVIGDRALGLFARGVPALDLSAEWERLTGLPFVFAVWAGPSARREAIGAAGRRLSRARDEGVLSDEPLRRARERLPRIPVAIMTRYLRQRIRYRLGAPELAGLSRFLDLAAKEVALPA